MTRKLIKPDLNEIKKFQKRDSKKKPPPPYKTHAENYYYIKQMNNRTPMIVVLANEEVIKGKIEWYDSKCIKIKKSEEDNLIVFKHFIKYMHKDPDFLDEKEIQEKQEKKSEEKAAATEE